MRSSLWLLIMLLAGCSSTPTVTYRKINDKTGDDILKNVSDSYYLNQSVIVVSPSESKDPSKPGPLTYTIASVPQENQGAYKVGVEPTNDWLSTTTINITKPENTERVGTIGTDTKENARDLIKAVGGLAASAIAMAGAPSSKAEAPKESCGVPLKAPFTINLSTALIAIDPDAVTYRFDDKAPNSACVQIEFGPLPLDARKSDSYQFDKKTSAYYYSACRSVTVTVTYPDKRVLKKQLKIADPNFIQSVHFPYKGVITMHSECGISVKTDATPDPLYSIGVVAEVLDQIQAVKKSEK